jgi:hypothetical protein
MSEWETCSHAWVEKAARTWVKTVGGKVSANRLYNRLQALWS